MIALIQIINGPSIALSYKIPDSYISLIFIGSLVRISLQQSIKLGIVLEINNEKVSFFLKEILYVYELSSSYHLFIEHLSNYYKLDKKIWYKKILSLLINRKNREIYSEEIKETESISISLNEEQENAYKSILSTKCYTSFLLYGITGSGKTSVYAKLANEYFIKNRSTIILAPEIVLANELYKKVVYFLPNIPVFLITSQTKNREKDIIFNFILSKKPFVLVGVHIPLFLPLFNLGIIIVDEEHDTSYIIQNFPFFNTKHIALVKAKIENIPIVLGSATPSISSLYLANLSKYKLLELKNKYFNISKSKITTIELNKNNRIENFPWISKELYQSVKETIENGEQAIIYLNRRGMYSYAECSSCKYIYICKNCSTPYTIHYIDHLHCHRCNQKEILASSCKICFKKTVTKKGLGTQQLVQIFQILFSNAIIERLDHDISISKKSLDGIIDRMHSGEINILIGTQLLSKGLHFKHVSFVGIISGDVYHLHSSYKAIEESVQKIIQVSGRAGREKNEGKVIIQLLENNRANSIYFSEEKYIEFYKEEIEKRKQYSYPPFSHYSLLKIYSKNEAYNEINAEKISVLLNNIAAENNLATFISMPFKQTPYKEKNYFYLNISLQAKNYKIISVLIDLWKKIDTKNTFNKEIYFFPTI